MVLSSGEVVAIGSGVQPQANVTPPSKSSYNKKDDDTGGRTTPKCILKEHKIRKHEKYRISGVIPEYYKSDHELAKTNIDSLVRLTSRFMLGMPKIIDDSNDYYVNSCYKIDYIMSPVRGKGEGTKAVKALVEKSKVDKDTDGRIIVDVKITDGETSAAGFFYKLGFRFTDENKNEQMNNWLRDKNAIIPPKLTGLMYLPKENMKRLLVYKMLL